MEKIQLIINVDLENFDLAIFLNQLNDEFLQNHFARLLAANIITKK